MMLTFLHQTHQPGTYTDSEAPRHTLKGKPAHLPSVVNSSQENSMHIQTVIITFINNTVVA